MSWIVRQVFGTKLVVRVSRTYWGTTQQSCKVERVDGSVKRVGHWRVEGSEEGIPVDKCHLCCLTNEEGVVDVKESFMAQWRCAGALILVRQREKAQERADREAVRADEERWSRYD